MAALRKYGFKAAVIVVLLVLAIFGFSETCAGQSCTTSTVFTPDGRTIICVTCCTNGTCTTTCF
jgi:hypothetical protein